MKYNDIPITGLEEFEGFKLIHKGMVSSNVVLGANVIKDTFASITDTVGGRSTSYEKTLDEALKKANVEIQKSALKLGANALVRVSYQYNSIGKNNTIMAIHAHATAVELIEIDN